MNRMVLFSVGWLLYFIYDYLFKTSMSHGHETITDKLMKTTTTIAFIMHFMSFIHIFIKFKFITFEMSLLCELRCDGMVWILNASISLCNGNGSWQNVRRKKKRAQASWIFNLNCLWMQNTAQFCVYINDRLHDWKSGLAEMFYTYFIQLAYAYKRSRLMLNFSLSKSLLFILNVICCDDSFVQNIENRDLTLINVTQFSLHADKNLL